MTPHVSSHTFIIVNLAQSLDFSPPPPLFRRAANAKSNQSAKQINVYSHQGEGLALQLSAILFYFYFCFKELLSSYLDLMTRMTLHSRSCLGPALKKKKMLSLKASFTEFPGCRTSSSDPGVRRLWHPQLPLTCSRGCIDPP